MTKLPNTPDAPTQTAPLAVAPCSPIEIVEINMRSRHPPYNTWRVCGYLPFEVFGENFDVTAIPAGEVSECFFRATHIATGAAVPASQCEVMAQVPAKTREVLESVGSEKLKKSLAKVAEILANKADLPT
jgi:hypothetical protein